MGTTSLDVVKTEKTIKSKPGLFERLTGITSLTTRDVIGTDGKNNPELSNKMLNLPKDR